MWVEVAGRSVTNIQPFVHHGPNLREDAVLAIRACDARIPTASRPSARRCDLARGPLHHRAAVSVARRRQATRKLLRVALLRDHARHDAMGTLAPRIARRGGLLAPTWRGFAVHVGQPCTLRGGGAYVDGVGSLRRRRGGPTSTAWGALRRRRGGPTSTAWGAYVDGVGSLRRRRGGLRRRRGGPTSTAWGPTSTAWGAYVDGVGGAEPAPLQARSVFSLGRRGTTGASRPSARTSILAR